VGDAARFGHVTDCFCQGSLEQWFSIGRTKASCLVEATETFHGTRISIEVLQRRGLSKHEAQPARCD
jgi:hypothetical protein